MFLFLMIRLSSDYIVTCSQVLTTELSSILILPIQPSFICTVLAAGPFHNWKEKIVFVISHLVPTLVILELGTNDIFPARPEVIGVTISDLVVFYLRSFSSVSYRGLRGYPSSASKFWLSQYEFQRGSCFVHRYVSVVLSELSWNPSGQYALYRSYRSRGVILRGLRMLWLVFPSLRSFCDSLFCHFSWPFLLLLFKL